MYVGRLLRGAGAYARLVLAAQVCQHILQRRRAALVELCLTHCARHADSLDSRALTPGVARRVLTRAHAAGGWQSAALILLNASSPKAPERYSATCRKHRAGVKQWQATRPEGDPKERPAYLGVPYSVRRIAGVLRGHLSSQLCAAAYCELREGGPAVGREYRRACEYTTETTAV